MKKILAVIACLLCLTGCFKRDDMENITIYTTVYPLEFVVQSLYGEYSHIESIYPRGVNVQLEICDECDDKLYKLNDTRIEYYSKGDLFIFNSLLYEESYVKPMSEHNRNLKIINGTDNLTADEFYGVEELWWDPSRLLTIARNIKNGLNEYVRNYYLKQDIENNFNELKEELDKLGSTLSGVTKNADNKNIVVSSDVFKFLSKDKYGLNVYSLEKNENLTAKTISDVKTLIENGQVKYIYIKQFEEVNDTIKDLIEGTDVEIIELHRLFNLTENEISNKKDYFTIMNENIELLRKGLYN